MIAHLQSMLALDQQVRELRAEMDAMECRTADNWARLYTLRREWAATKAQAEAAYIAAKYP